MSRKKRKKRSKSKIRKIRKRFKYILIIVILIGIVLGLYLLLYRSHYFRLKKLKIEGKYSLSVSQILRDSSLNKGESMWNIDLKRVSNRLIEKNSEYRKIIIKRKLPHTLTFRFVLRKPIAQIKSGRYFLVDKYSFILPQVKNVAVVDLPVIKGVDLKLAGVKPGQKCENKAVKNTVALLNAIDNSFLDLDKIKYVVASDYKNLFFKLKRGVIVKIGDEDFKPRIKKLKYILKEIKDKDIAYVDLRFEDPVLSPR